MRKPQTRHSFQRPVNGMARARYLLFLPRDYTAEGRRKWPLMLFLHGAGERGSDLTQVAHHGPPKIVAEQPDFPFIVVSPQCPRGQHWSNQILLPLIDDILEHHSVDTARIYLTGLSMGGYGVWNLALTFPERFAAVAPICGGGDILKVLLAEPKKLRALKSLGIWAFHGANDPIVPVLESERMIAALREIGNSAKLTIYPDTEHDSWTETYNNPALYEWFLSHRRLAPKRRRTLAKAR